MQRRDYSFITRQFLKTRLIQSMMVPLSIQELPCEGKRPKRRKLKALILQDLVGQGDDETSFQTASKQLKAFFPYLEGYSPPEFAIVEYNKLSYQIQGIKTIVAGSQTPVGWVVFATID